MAWGRDGGRPARMHIARCIAAVALAGLLLGAAHGSVASGQASLPDLRSAEVYNGRGLAWFDRKDYGKAIAAFDEAIRIAPGNARAYNNRGNARAGTGTDRQGDRRLRPRHSTQPACRGGLPQSRHRAAPGWRPRVGTDRPSAGRATRSEERQCAQRAWPRPAEPGGLRAGDRQLQPGDPPRAAMGGGLQQPGQCLER
ncbi:MAG: tetratricopeptide repeat protein [Rhizobiales bacterium]|nr:tetratricopeptide repeat protein [Hyphomicrobiales bacterium]